MQNIKITAEAPTIAGQIPIASGVAVGENHVRTGEASTLFAVIIWLFASPQAMALAVNTKPAVRPPLNLTVDGAPVSTDSNIASSFAAVIKKVEPSVLQMFVRAKPKNQLPNQDFETLRRFFQHRLFDLNPERSLPRRTLGSGVIASSNGYILTNYHLVRDASEIQVVLMDHRTFAAEVIGTDPRTDIAFLKVEANDLPAITFANSDLVEVGDVVLAIGNPFGIGQTLTQGIVSAKNRATSSKMDQDFIQTDAAINPGNSGGALVDVQGRLVGVNAAILTGSGGNQGIGFAIPSNLCRWVMESLVKKGHVERGLLGVTVQDLSADLARAFQTDRNSGALVADLQPGGPAERAGFKTGDVIIAFNGKPVENSTQLKLLVAETPPGTRVPVEIGRDGAKQIVEVTLQALSDEDQSASKTETPSRKGALRGVAVTHLDREVSEEQKIPPGIQGALVTEVSSDSAAYDAGLRPGDVIVEINRIPVRSEMEVAAITNKTSGDQTLIRIWRQGASHYLTVDESKTE
jgi:serine protease Do